MRKRVEHLYVPQSSKMNPVKWNITQNKSVGDCVYICVSICVSVFVCVYVYVCASA